ncbi:hypothetical protein VTI28DRAFT_7114 [Corynascus sepedonium]
MHKRRWVFRRNGENAAILARAMQWIDTKNCVPPDERGIRWQHSLSVSMASPIELASSEIPDFRSAVGGRTPIMTSRRLQGVDPSMQASALVLTSPAPAQVVVERNV